MRLTLLVLALVVPAAKAQWQILDSHTTADLRGIDNVGNGVAWTSGSKGAILRTEDGGRVWQLCATPPGGANLDFRSIQAFSATTAVVMASGKGELSRIYKTTDGCQTWREVFDNPDATGSFDALHRISAFQMYLLGDPVNGKFAMFSSPDAGNTWSLSDDPGLDAPKGVGAFPAVTADLTNVGFLMAFGIGGRRAAVYTFSPTCENTTDKCALAWTARTTPLAQASTTAGVFSLAGRTTMVPSTAPVTGIATMPATTLVAVGGDYEKPTENSASAAFSNDSGATWKLAAVPPGGYRSAVAFDPERDRFIAVGPNGTDVSNDDGNVWRALKPGPGDDPEADQHWAALSLPFVVGPHGRIGTLRADLATALKAGNKR